MARIENYSYTPQQAFNECYYEVPDYQRGYVWSEREVTQLLDDINEQADADGKSEYFIGMILVSPSPSQTDHFEVIDGQQRLTTLFLLLSAIKHRLGATEQQRAMIEKLLFTTYVDDKGEIRKELRLVPRYEGASEVFGKLMAVPPDDGSVATALKTAGVPVVGSVDNLLKAYAVAGKWLLDNFATDGELKRFWGFLANRVVFIQIRTDVSNALKIFETINERGVGLNPMDLLKNLLFRSVTPGDFARLKTAWDQITLPLAKANEKPLRFLRYFLMANYPVKNDRSDGVIREDEIYDWLTGEANSRLCAYRERPFEFVRKIAVNVGHYLSFANGRGVDGADSPALARLKIMAGGAFSLHFVLLLAAAGFPGALFEHLVGQLEAFLFFYIYTKTPTKELERNFSAWADELRTIGAIADGERQKMALNNFVATHFASAITAKTGELSDALRRYSLWSMQRYRTIYLLARITQYVDMFYSGAREEGGLGTYTRLEVEHILPQTPEDDLRTAWVAANKNSPYDEYAQRLGNLTLLEKPINIVASNDFFDKKLPEYAKSGNYLTRSTAGLVPVGKNSSITRINAKLKAFRSWDAKNIEARQQMLADLALDIWRTHDVDMAP